MLYFSRWKTTLIWLAVLAGVVFAAPTFWTASSRRTACRIGLPSKQLTLGLDLQGGSYMLLQVERQDIIKDRLTTTVDDVRRLLREAGIGYTGLSGTGQMVQVRIRDEARVEEAKETLSELSEPVASGLFGGGYGHRGDDRGTPAGPAPHPADG
jgi:SecD/SecF fusion protein